MAIQFVIGRAGAGKTDFCLESVRRRLIDAPVAGPRLLVLVPEQAALQTERALIDDPRLGGSHRAEVMGFARLAERILVEVRQLDRVALSLNGRAMTLRYLMGKLEGQLQYYRRAERFSGFIEHLSQAVGELFEEAVEPDDLADAAAAAQDPIQCRKLADLHLLYAAYRDYLGQEKVDPSQFLDLAKQGVDRTPWLAGAEIWVDGFAGFTRTEALLLAELAKVAAGIQVTAMADPEQANPTVKTSGATLLDPTCLFAKPLRTLGRLHQIFVEAGLEVTEPVLLRPAPPPRFAHSPQLAWLERHLFDEAAPVSPETGPAAALELVGLPDRRLEVTYAVSRVSQWVQRQENPLRYRDIALICRDLEPYHELIAAALDERGIPFFIDRRRPIAHHPLVELLRSLVAVAEQDASIESVRLMVKTGLLGLTGQAADELENFLLAYGIAGLDLWSGPDWSPVGRQHRVGKLHDPAPEPSTYERNLAQRVNATRRHLMNELGDWLACARSDAPTDGLEWARRIGCVLEKLGAADQLERWAGAAEQDGDLDAAEEHRQVWRDVVTFIDDLADALGDRALTLKELAAVLQAGLSQFTLGLAPPMIDQVLVGAIERSRHPEIKAVVVLGFNDSIFPTTGSEGTILNDGDRTWLAERGLVVGTPRRQRILEERLLVYVALTRASEATVVTWPGQDEAGQPLRISPFATDLRSAAGQLLETTVTDPVIHRRMDLMGTAGDVAGGLALEFRGRPESPAADGPVRATWNGLYESARTDPGLCGPLGQALRSLDYANRAELSPGVVDRLVEKPFAASVSRLERFAACPFQHFANYHLKLTERPLAELADVDLGKLHHAILEDLVQHLVDQGQSLAQLDEAGLLDRLNRSADRIGLRPALAQSRTVARQAYRLRRSREELAKIVQAQGQVASLGRFRSQGVEVPFGFDKQSDSLPALRIDTPAGRTVVLRGYIDRVDLAELADEMLGVVIDYKRTRDKRLNWSQVYHGISLQLIGYLLALAEHGHTLAGRSIRPIGAFYVSLIADYKKLDHPGQYDEAKHAACKRLGPRGLLDVGRIKALESDYAGGQAQVYQVQTKGGTIQYANRSDAVTSEQFTALLEHTRYKLGELADGVLDGDVRVAPYRLNHFSPCQWCDYRSVCRFEFGHGGLRPLPGKSRTQVLDDVAERA